MIGITDLSLALLRNFTRFPFVIGDSPCVFYNRYLYDVPFVSGLGIQSPGLMIFMPLNEQTQVMLYDPGTYRVQGSRVVLDLIQNADVSQLNALQVHAAQSSIYFSDDTATEYVLDLMAAHRPTFRQSTDELQRWSPGEIQIDGKPSDREVMQIYEGQLSLKTELSFVETMPMPADENPRRARSPELRRELMAIGDRVPL